MTIDEFIEGWGDDSAEAKQFLVELYEKIKSLDDTTCTFTGRPGVSYSLRPKRGCQKDRDFFAMVDVIDDDPTDRWLSVCFYGDTITDPEEKGDFVPGGLAGGDGHCFDAYSFEDELKQYILARIQEAWDSVA